MKKIILPFIAISMLFSSCSSSETSEAEYSKDILLDKLTVTMDNYESGLKPGTPLAEIVKYDAYAKVNKEDPNEYESKFKTSKVTGYFFYTKRFSFSDAQSKTSNLDEILMNFEYLETTDKATGKDIVIDYKPYVDFITKRLGVSPKMGSEEEGEEDRYFWEKDGLIFQLNPDWNGLEFTIATPEEEE